jgi:ABC-2 type transport system ATP-binding protein
MLGPTIRKELQLLRRDPRVIVRLLVLDEPTVGVDPQSRRHIFDSIRALRASGMAVVYTSHYMEEVEELCDRVAIMDAGKIVALGTVAELAHDHARGVELELAGEPAAIDAAAVAAEAFGATRDGAVLRCERPTAWAPLVTAIEATGAQVTRIDARRANLETVFLALTGRGLRDA